MLYLHNVGGLFCLPLPFSSMGLLIPMAMINQQDIDTLSRQLLFSLVWQIHEKAIFG
jgi:hypothetical protein